MRLTLIIIFAVFLYPCSYNSCNATPNAEANTLIVKNNTTEKKFVLFAYKTHPHRKYAAIFTLMPNQLAPCTYPPGASDKYIQTLESSLQLKVTGEHQYHLANISKGRPRKAPYKVTSWGTILITNDTNNPKDVEFKYSSWRYTIRLLPSESIPVPYSKHWRDTPLVSNKTIHVLGHSGKKTIAHDKKHFCVSQLILQ